MDRSRETRCAAQKAGAGALEDRSATDLGMQLASLVESGAERQREAYDLVCRLAKLAERDDANAWAVAALIRQESMPGIAKNFLAGALGSAGTLAAQEMLADLLQERGFDPGFRSACLIALSAVESPGEKAEWTLRDLVDEVDKTGVNTNALLVLGVMASRLSHEHAPRQSDIARFIMDRERSLLDGGHIKTFLAALGNAGADESYPVVETYLRDSDDAVRAAAIAALKRLEHEGVDGHLRAALRDQSSDVQLAAIETLGSRPVSPEDLDVIGQAALRAEENRLRRAAIVFLGDRIADSTSGRDILERVTAEEPDEDLRRLARDYLTGADA